ncbi:MAG TPA: molybdopterin cofactor-binding domain-containing protein, partial [Chthonomonadaceae bacterium]|nr:molybdopterin cofactor-binding domain-containing protein [Chthonomonadaceae bacterium]
RPVRGRQGEDGEVKSTGKQQLAIGSRESGEATALPATSYTPYPEPYAAEVERYELRAAPRYRFAMTRRGLFKALGAGLLVIVCIEGVEAQESGRPGRGRGGRGGGAGPTDIGAWLHFGENGIVTAYTGKAEVGQNIRTSLSQAVAEELRIPAASVTLVMADTALTPYDAGTFGSRTTPGMAPILHRAAAAAREALIDRAAEEWKVDRAGITAANGKVIHAASHHEVAYAQLVAGQKLTREVSGAVSEVPRTEWTVAGSSVPKADGRAFVTGRHAYTSDIARGGMVYGRIVRPAAWNAKLKSADTSAAERLPGVTVVRDGELLGVTAPNSHAAERAASLIKAVWDAPAPAAEERLWETLHGGPLPGSEGGGAPARLKTVYTVAYIAHAPLEPRAAVAEWQGGKLTVWTGTQRPFGVRTELAQAFGIPEADVRVITPDTGAAYGGKHTGEAAIEAARLAKGAGKPVKLVWTREEEFNWAYFRPAGVITVGGDAAQDGTLKSWEFHNYNSGGSGLATPYDVADKHEQFHNGPSPLRQGSYRGLAATANHFVRESHMDDLAVRLHMDPLAFRQKNLTDARLRAVLEAAAKRFGWEGRQPKPDHGYGLACGTEKGSYVANCVELAIDPKDRGVRLVRIVSAFECGAIVNPTHLQNQVEGATVMGIGGALFEAIHFDQGRVTNARFSKYRVPRFGDVPPIEVVLLDRKDIPSAGAGETPIVAIAPAIRNAILNATGIALRSLPMIPNGLGKE